VSRRPGARSAAFSRRPAVSPAQPLSRAALGAVPPRSLRRGAAALAAAALLCAPALAACASGTDAMTNLARTTTNTANGAVGTIDLRNVYVAGPVETGGDAQVISALFNGGSEDDELVGISSPDAAGGKPGSPATLAPAGGQIYIANGSAPALTGLKKDLPVGSATKVTFTFAKAGSVTLDVPVEKPAPGASASPTATPSASATAAATASATAAATASATAAATATATATGTASPAAGSSVSPTAGSTAVPGTTPTAG